MANNSPAREAGPSSAQSQGSPARKAKAKSKRARVPAVQHQSGAVDRDEQRRQKALEKRVARAERQLASAACNISPSPHRSRSTNKGQAASPSPSYVPGGEGKFHYLPLCMGEM